MAETLRVYLGYVLRSVLSGHLQSPQPGSPFLSFSEQHAVLPKWLLLLLALRKNIKFWKDGCVNSLEKSSLVVVVKVVIYVR